MTISATTGLISSIDYSSLIQQLVGVKQQPIDRLNSDKDALKKLNSAYSTLSTRISDFRSAADALRASVGFNAFTTSVTDSTILGASATSSAAIGSHEVKVTALAKAHSIAADGVSAESTVIATAAGSFSFKVGTGAVQTVAVDATTTLSSLRDSINNLNAGVTAAIVNDGSGAKPYRLVLTSDTTGASNGITVTQNDTWVSENSAALTFSTTLQAAQDASVVVDNMTYTRSSNSVSDIVTGVTLDLKSADAAKTVTLTVGRDTEDIKKKITSFVDKFNAVVSYIKAKNRYDTDTHAAGEFFGDTVARSVLDDLRKKMTSVVTGLPDTMNRLIHAGVTTDSEGVMKIDSSKLSTALSSSFDAVVDLFAGDGVNTGLAQSMYDLADDIGNTADSRIQMRLNGIGDSIRSIENTVRDKEYELDLYERDLRARFTALETMLAGLKTQSSYILALTSGR